MKLLTYIQENKTTILLSIGFLCAFIGYSFHSLLWDGAFYHLTSLAFVLFLLRIYLKSTGKDSLLAFVVLATSVNSFIDEIFFNPKLIELNEYIGFLLIIIITLRFKNKWLRR